jgi:hypothetical protein
MFLCLTRIGPIHSLDALRARRLFILHCNTCISFLAISFRSPFSLNETIVTRASRAKSLGAILPTPEIVASNSAPELAAPGREGLV